MRDDRERLLDMPEAIAQIEKYAARGRGAFEQDELVQQWVRSHLLVLGEAARGISEGLRRRHPEVRWSSIIGMRSLRVHQYFGIDNAVVWAVVQNDLPGLRSSLAAILAQAGDGR